MIFNAAITTGIVCRPNCPPGRRTKPENRKYFKSLNDAYDEGFRDCLVCKPVSYTHLTLPTSDLV